MMEVLPLQSDLVGICLIEAYLAFGLTPGSISMRVLKSVRSRRHNAKTIKSADCTERFPGQHHQFYCAHDLGC